MKYREFGRKNAETLLLLHGGGLSWWNYRTEAALLKEDYHIIVPFLDGHAGSDRQFTSIEENASGIVAFIRKHLGGEVCCICGLSLGGQILLEMLAQDGAVCRHAMIESAMVIPSPLTHALIAPAFGCSYPLIRQKWFARMQFRQLKIRDDLFDAYYRDTCAVSRQDMIAFLKANTSYQLKAAIRACSSDVHIYYGERENRGIRRSAERIHAAIPGSTLTALKGLYHGAFSINHPAAYCRAVRAVTGRL